MQKTGFATKIRSLFVFPVYLKNALEPVVCPVVLAKEARQHSAAEKKNSCCDVVPTAEQQAVSDDKNIKEMCARVTLLRYTTTVGLLAQEEVYFSKCLRADSSKPALVLLFSVIKNVKEVAFLVTFQARFYNCYRRCD